MKIRVTQLSETEILVETDHVSICVVYGRARKCKKSGKKCKIGNRLTIYQQYGNTRVVLSQSAIGKLLDILLTVIGMLLGEKYYIRRGQIFTILSTLLNIKYVTHTMIGILLQYCKHVNVCNSSISRVKGRNDVKYLIELVQPIEFPYETELNGSMELLNSNRTWLTIRRLQLSKFVKICDTDRQYVNKLLDILLQSDDNTRKRIVIYYIYGSFIVTVCGMCPLRRADPCFRVFMCRSDTHAIVYDGDDIYRCVGTNMYRIERYETLLQYILQMFPILTRNVINIVAIGGKWLEKCIRKYLQYSR